MSDSKFTVEQFRKLALDRFSFLEEKGFHHESKLDETVSTYGTVVYLGKHVGFIFSLDVRDQCVDGSVVKVCNGQMKPNWHGGYSCNIFGHLVKHHGYRGGSQDTDKLNAHATGDARLQRMLDTWARLLMESGLSLLSDGPNSLPE